MKTLPFRDFVDSRLLLGWGSKERKTINYWKRKQCTHFVQPEVCDTSPPAPQRTLQRSR